MIAATLSSGEVWEAAVFFCDCVMIQKESAPIGKGPITLEGVNEGDAVDILGRCGRCELPGTGDTSGAAGEYRLRQVGVPPLNV